MADKIKIEIKTIWGRVLFTRESEGNTIKETLVDAYLRDADLRGADLRGADLGGAYLRGADLGGADLRDANLRDADLRGANLRDANLRDAYLRGADLRDVKNLELAKLREIKHDIWGVLLYFKNEVPAFRKALVEGRIDGSQYSGECACLMGTVANIKACKYDEMALRPDASSLAERWFLAIREGSTPDNHPIAKLTLEWVDEFIKLIA